MAEVKSNNSITIMKYNNISGVDISIRASNDDEVLILHDDVEFLASTINQWLKEDKEGANESN